jgi:hypothetical protein
MAASHAAAGPDAFGLGFGHGDLDDDKQEDDMTGSDLNADIRALLAQPRQLPAGEAMRGHEQSLALVKVPRNVATHPMTTLSEMLRSASARARQQPRGEAALRRVLALLTGSTKVDGA